MEASSIRLGPAVASDPALSQRIDACRDVLAEEISLPTATAVWDADRDERGRTVLRLRIQDSSGAEATGDFAPDELDREAHLRLRLHELLGAALRVNHWRVELHKLYAKVQAWLQDREPPVGALSEDVELDELHSGPYEVQRLRLVSGASAALLEPVGCWIVGAEGRVDLHGAGGQEVLLLQEHDRWEWIPCRERRTQPVEVTEDVFVQLLDRVTAPDG